MPRLDLGSDAPLPDIDSLPIIRPLDDEEESAEGPGGKEIWLNGDVLMCVCPDCKAPLSVRVWLMLAECWRCDTCVELTEQQQREARRLIQQREAPPPPAEKPPPDRRAEIPPRAVAPPSARPQARPGSPAPPAAALAGTAPPPLPAARGSAAAPTPAAKSPPAGAKPANTRRLRKAKDEGGILLFITDFFRSMPAWMVSLVVHIVLLTLLALLTKDQLSGTEEFILVSTTVAPEKKEGAEVRITKPEEEVKFDLPIPDKEVPKTEDQKRAMILADQDARQLRLDPNVDAPNLRDLVEVKRQISMSDSSSRMVAARDPRVRVEMVKREGGTTLTEAAVSRGLRWLASVQNEDGSWSLEKHGGNLKSDSAATSLALLPFLGAGQTHQQGVYRDHVAKGLRWLVERQDKKTGDLRIDSQGNAGMYAHGQGAIVLSEAFAMTGDENLRVPAQKALDFIRDAQHPAGGWRYSPGEAGDTSVLGWQLMALQSGRAAFLTVNDSTLQLAGHYLDSAEFDDRTGFGYSYQPRGGHRNQAMTAEGLLCRMYLGWTFHDRRELQRGVDTLVEQHMPSKDRPDVYYWYYGTQVFHHAGGEAWDKWNNRMRDILVETQEKRGPDAGSWPVLGPHAAPGGRIYVTSLCTATLEIYYRHAPIFRQIKLD